MYDAQACIAKAKKVAKISSETKSEIEAFEGKLEATAAEKQEEQAAAKQADADVDPEAASEDMDAGEAGNTQHCCMFDTAPITS